MPDNNTTTPTTPAVPKVPGAPAIPGAPALPTTPALARDPGNLITLPTDDEGKPKKPSLQISVKLDIAVEVHITARVHGDIIIGLL